LSVAELVLLVRSGPAAAPVAELVKRFHSRVCAWILRHAPGFDLDPAEIPEAIQEVSLHLVQELAPACRQASRSEDVHLPGLLFSIAGCRLRDFVRRWRCAEQHLDRSLTAAAALQETIASWGNPVASAEGRELAAIVDLEVGALPGLSRPVWELHRGGSKLSAIARELGVSRPVVRHLLARVKIGLRAKAQDWVPGMNPRGRNARH
jgi:hypothetical protein